MTTDPIPPQRELRAGRDYPVWPYLKWGHAVRMHQRLANDYNLWRGSLAAETRAEYSADRRTVTFFATIANQPPTYEWSLSFGDIVHNYRSALDSLAWSMAHLDGKRPHPRHEKRIYFPLTRSRTEFDKLASTSLSSVPEDVLDRMQSVQPYHGARVNDAIGLTLHDLDIQDKHRSAIEMRAVAADKTSYALKVSYETKADGVDDGCEPEWIAPDRTIQDGDPVAVMRFSRPVRLAEIEELPLVLMVEDKGQRRDVWNLLALIDRQVGATFRRVERGFLKDDAEYFGMSASADDGVG
ncbi:hypothetical protein MRBLMI12_000265 [Microbacterium sp. LMI12-1-1.1]|uniref:hypothetical protein n=1 Tax=Microbacterium sp. LMI12-1-1.1 TaxID=3135225 RepID=UPI00342E1068